MYKFHVYSKAHSKAIQTVLYKNGFEWIENVGNREFQNLYADYIFAGYDSSLDKDVITFTNDSNYFRGDLDFEEAIIIDDEIKTVRGLNPVSDMPVFVYNAKKKMFKYYVYIEGAFTDDELVIPASDINRNSLRNTFDYWNDLQGKWEEYVLSLALKNRITVKELLKTNEYVPCKVWNDSDEFSGDFKVVLITHLSNLGRYIDTSSDFWDNAVPINSSTGEEYELYCQQ